MLQLVRIFVFLFLCLFVAPANAVDNYINIIAIPTNVVINTAVTSSTLIMTTENGTRNFYVTAVHVQTVAQSGVVTPANISVGTNSTAYNNIMASTVLSGLGSLLNLPINLSAASAILPSNTTVYAKVNTAIVGTSQTVTLTVIGYYL